jgi:hypothetical protein
VKAVVAAAVTMQVVVSLPARGSPLPEITTAADLALPFLTPAAAAARSFPLASATASWRTEERKRERKEERKEGREDDRKKGGGKNG